MGFTAAGIEFLLLAEREGVDFRRTMTLGRQGYAWVDAAEMARVFRAAGRPMSEADASADLAREQRFAGPLLERLGALEIRSMDASPFEGATDVHDLNEPIPQMLAEQFSVVIDGGTLEHVFNFPRAIANAMEMVEVGGHLLLLTPTNNEGGHGFYQFSPELLFRVLSPENGFSVDRMLLREHLGRRWYEVIDPVAIGRRVQFRSTGSAYLYVRARRERVVPLFQKLPQQSDYVTAWNDGDASGSEVSAMAAGRNLSSTGTSWKARARSLSPQFALRRYRKAGRRLAVRREQRPAVYRRCPEQFREVDLRP
jgi:SAM-dependent methyltransferase